MCYRRGSKRNMAKYSTGAVIALTITLHCDYMCVYAVYVCVCGSVCVCVCVYVELNTKKRMSISKSSCQNTDAPTKLDANVI